MMTFVQTRLSSKRSRTSLVILGFFLRVPKYPTGCDSQHCFEVVIMVFMIMLSSLRLISGVNNQSAEGAGGLGIIRSNKVGETE